MYTKFIPIVLVVLSSACYHVSQKSTPNSLNPIVALIVTYVIASIVSIFSYFLFVPNSNLIGLLESIKNANWASLLLGFAVVGLELGFLLAYRKVWNISVAGFLSNTLVALMLIPVGLLLFKETISLRYALPCGGKDLDTFVGDVSLTKAVGNEYFVTLGTDENIPPYEGEIVYKDDNGAICR